jgi:hypothetical protein
MAGECDNGLVFKFGALDIKDFFHAYLDAIGYSKCLLSRSRFSYAGSRHGQSDLPCVELTLCRVRKNAISPLDHQK